MTPTLIDPILLVVLRMIHHFEHVNPARSVRYLRLVTQTSYKPEAIIAHVEHNAVSDLINRSKYLLYLGEVRPIGILCKFVPGSQAPFRDSRVMLSRLPEITQGAL